jgi:antitoxin (DNA-binding transcriptional repressor) of toxin-antitoxin stability system
MKIGAAKFKEQCLALIETLSKEGIVITKHGKAIAKVLPIEEQSESLIGVLKHKIKINGDIESTGVSWDAES